MFITDEISNIRLMDLSVEFLEAFYSGWFGNMTGQTGTDVVCVWMGH